MTCEKCGFVYCCKVVILSRFAALFV